MKALWMNRIARTYASRTTHVPLSAKFILVSALFALSTGLALAFLLAIPEPARVPLPAETARERVEPSVLTRDRVMALGGVIVSTGLGLLLQFMLLRSINTRLRSLRRTAEGLATGEAQPPVLSDSRDELTHLAEKLALAVQGARATAATTNAGARELEAILAAISHTSAGLMITDHEGVIRYHNNTVKSMFKVAQEDLSARYPGFDVDQLIGKSIDVFHRRPEHQRQLLASLKSEFRTRVSVGSRAFDLVVNPVHLPSGERIGCIAEWVDHTDQIRLDKAVADMVIAATAGDFSARIPIEAGADATFVALATNINRLVDTVAAGLAEIDEMFKALAEGDLTRRAATDLRGDFARILGNSNRTVERLADLLGKIQNASAAVDVAAREIASGNADLSLRTEKQAARLEETASTMEELTSGVRHTADGARSVNDMVKSASETANAGGTATARVVSIMADIHSSSTRIADITSVIDGIAFQTNILALNAAVEAARAGEHGRGFSVVASEVRALSNRCADAAREIRQLIADAVTQVEVGSRDVEEAGATIQRVVESVTRVTLVISEISEAAREQARGIEQVNTAVSDMDRSTQQNAALVEESAAAAESLRGQAAELSALLAQFRLAASDARAEPVVHRVQPRRVEHA